MTVSSYLIHIETSGNQAHLFETNKLAENVGASQQLFLLGTTDVLRATQKWLTEVVDVDDVLDSQKNPPLDSPQSNGVEIWYLSSGKSMIFARDRNTAVSIVSDLTRRAATDYPGVVVRGAIATIEERSIDALEKAVGDVHRKIESKKNSLPPDECRYLRLPIVKPCTSSGLPASTIVRTGETESELSEVSFRKRCGPDGNEGNWRDNIHERLTESLPEGLRTANVMAHLESWQNGDGRYLAVVHADGNGIGKLFRDFSQFAAVENAHDYVEKLRRFSWEIDKRTRNAFNAAVENVCRDYSSLIGIDQASRDLKTPVLPLILGGDDLTLISTSEFAAVFVPEFLQRFEAEFQCSDELTTQRGTVASIAADIIEKATGSRHLGITASIAYVKPHFPFYLAYQMAEGLLSNAKRELKSRLTTLKDGEKPASASAFDFHVHHSAGGGTIADIRRGIEFLADNQEYRLYGGPYITTSTNALTLSPEAERWMESRQWEQLRLLVEELSASEADDETRRRISNAQLHQLRAALFDGANADDQISLVSHRYDNALLQSCGDESQSVWFRDTEGASINYTNLLDAMALAHLGAPFAPGS